MNKKELSKFRVMSSFYKSSRLTNLVFETKVWLSQTPYSFADEFIEVFNELIHPMKEKVNFYQTLMSDWKLVNKKTFSLPKMWLKTSKRNKERYLFIREAKAKNNAADSGLMMWFNSKEVPYPLLCTPLLRQILPVLPKVDPEFLLRGAISIGNRLPFLCGHVSYCIETSPILGNNLQFDGNYAAIQLSRKYPGATISNHLHDQRLCLFRGIEGVGWLTMVGKEPLEKIGGVDGLKKSIPDQEGIKIHEVKYGVIIQAGPEPALTPSKKHEIPLYESVYSALKYLIETDSENLLTFQLKGVNNPTTLTQEWHRRFQGGVQ